MNRIIDILQSEYLTEYYNKVIKLKFTTPKIYPKIVLSKAASSFSVKEKKEVMIKYKRWYVYYSYVNPDTNKLTRQPSIFFNLNRKFKDFDSRLHHIKIIRNSIEKLLKDGYSPYKSATEVKLFSCKSALDFAVSLKKASLKESSFNDYYSRIEVFKKYLDKKGILHRPITQINKLIVTNFLNSILKQSSARNRNNTRTILSSIFSTLEDNELIDRNFIKNIKPLKSNATRNKTYTSNQVNEIYTYLDQHDKQLLLFIKFVSYNFLRPIEVCRLQVKDIDLDNNLIHIKAKNKEAKTKIIPTIILQDLKKLNLSKFLPSDFIFSPLGIGIWNTTEVNKRNYFTKRYKRVKQQLNLNADYTIYSFRHTFITKLFKEFKTQNSLTETYDKLMLITGHSTLKALQQYLRNIDAELPEDYSDLLIR